MSNIIPEAKAVCALCNRDEPLIDSHFIPAFVFRWVKETSATGYLRSAKNANLRVQDGDKNPFLCNDCEQQFSRYERLYKNCVFDPYVNVELNGTGVGQGALKSIRYEDWLSNFSTSLHWRNIAYHLQYSASDKHLPFPNSVCEKLKEPCLHWKRFLTGSLKDPGAWQQHIFFFQNLAAGYGHLPSRIPEGLNYYLLRAIDRTIAFNSSGRQVFSFVKLGPIAHVAYINPNRPSRKMNNTRIRKAGALTLAQKMADTNINEFIFITRPKEVLPNLKMSDVQACKVESTIRKDLDRAANSMSFAAQLGDRSIGMALKNGREK